MLKKIQRRFILASMAAFGMVMFVIVAGINIANYMQTISMQDRLAMELLLHGPQALKRPRENGPPRRDFPGRGPEAEFFTRFFTVQVSPQGNVEEISRDHISSIDDETAAAYLSLIHI